jgi:hypothetical protein
MLTVTVVAARRPVAIAGLCDDRWKAHGTPHSAEQRD